MAYVFCVDKTNLPKCLDAGIFGVPNSTKAYSQIMNVKPGDDLFLYVYGEKRVYGVYTCSSPFYTERFPERGPWTGRERDAAFSFYAHRIEIDFIADFPVGLSIDEVERQGIGIKENLFKGKSVLFISDVQTKLLETMLRSKNKGAYHKGRKYLRVRQEKVEVAFEQLPGNTESRLQLYLQRNMRLLETSLEVVDTYYNLKEDLGYEGEIDILARDKVSDFVVVELKVGSAPPEIWSQLFSYSQIVDMKLARPLGRTVRSMLVCENLGRKTYYAYPYLQSYLKEARYLRVFQYKFTKGNQLKVNELQYDFS